MRKLWKQVTLVVTALTVMLVLFLESGINVQAAEAPREPQVGDTFFSDSYPGGFINYQFDDFSTLIIPKTVYNNWSHNLKIWGTPYGDTAYRSLKYDNTVPNQWEYLVGSSTSIQEIGMKSEDEIYSDFISYGYAFFWVTDSGSCDLGNSSENHTHSWTYGTIVEATESTDGLEGEYCACGAIRNTTVISAGGAIVDNSIAKIDAAKSGQSIVIDMKTMCNLSQAFMKKLAEKNSTSFTIKLIYNNKPYEFYVPAGTQFDTSLPYYGPEKLMEMFEYKQL